MANAKTQSNKEAASPFVPAEEQPYEVPKNWCWTSVGAISSVISKGTTPKGGKDAYVESGIGFLRVENISDNGKISHENIKYITNEMHMGFLKRSILAANDVLVSIAGTLGKTAIVSSEDLPLNTNQALAFIRLSPDVCQLAKYIRLVIDSPIIQELLLKQTKVTSIPNLTLEIIANCPIPIPPLPEQQRIVDRIESLFAKLDEAKEKAQAVVDGFELRKSAILHKAFTGELTAQWRKEQGVGMDSWEQLTLNDIAEYKKGPFGSSITKVMFVPKSENTYKVYEQGNAIRKTLDYGHYYISEKKYKELSGFSVRGGDIIVSCAGTIGEIYKLPDNCEEGVINQALMRVRIFNNTDERFFIYYFSGVLKGDVIDQANGTAIKNIPPFKVMKAMPIHHPTIEEQQKICDILDDLLLQQQQSKEAAEAVLDQIDTMKKAILARAFRGELGTNNPDEESAAELLKRI